MATNSVPKDFMSARILSLLKKAHLVADDFKNYRPVSNLLFIFKILEKVGDKHIEHHLACNMFHKELQSVYRKFHSTEFALLMVQSDILQYVSVFIMLDLSAVFDIMDHQSNALTITLA